MGKLEKTNCVLAASIVVLQLAAALSTKLDTDKFYLSYGSTFDGDRPPKALRPKTSAARSSGSTRTSRGVQEEGITQAPQFPVSRPATAKSRYA